MSNENNGLHERATVLKNVRIAYPNLFTPAPDAGGRDKYSCLILIEKTVDIDHVKAAVKAAIDYGVKKKWGGSKPSNLLIPIKDGDKYADAEPEKPRDFYRGHYFINAKQDPDYGKPVVYDIHGLETEAQASINSGDFVHAVLEFFPYKGPSGSGISCSPKAIRKHSDGDVIGGGVSKTAAMAALGIDANEPKKSESDSLDDLF